MYYLCNIKKRKKHFNNINYMTTKVKTMTMTESHILDANVIAVGDKPNVDVKREIKVIDDNGNINISALSEEDKKRYSQLTKNLVVTDINSISNYGSDMQNVMGKYSNDFLTSVRTPQSGEIGTLITDLLSELNYIDVDELKEPSALTKVIRKIPILNKLVKSVDKILNKYDSIAGNVDAISKKIAVTRLTSLRDNNALQTMFENNIIYGKQIEDLIIAGKIKLEEVNSTLNEMMENQDKYEPHQIQDVQEFAHNLERRLSDLMSLRYVIKQSLPQIRTVQYNNIAIADKAQSIIATTIPLWKNQLSIAVALHNQKANIDAHRKITETTNAILKKNAEMLHQNSTDVARENERSVVDIETLRDTTRHLIDTIKEVKQIHEECTAKRKAAEEEILKIESELDANMISTSNMLKLLN